MQKQSACGASTLMCWPKTRPCCKCARSLVSAKRTWVPNSAALCLILRTSRANEIGASFDDNIRSGAPRLDARGSLYALCPALSRPHVSRPERSSTPVRTVRSADLDAAFDQDRRLPGGLRLLPAERAL